MAAPATPRRRHGSVRPDPEETGTESVATDADTPQDGESTGMPTMGDDATAPHIPTGDDATTSPSASSSHASTHAYSDPASYASTHASSYPASYASTHDSSDPASCASESNDVPAPTASTPHAHATSEESHPEATGTGKKVKVMGGAETDANTSTPQTGVYLHPLTGNTSFAAAVNSAASNVEEIRRKQHKQKKTISSEDNRAKRQDGIHDTRKKKKEEKLRSKRSVVSDVDMPDAPDFDEDSVQNMHNDDD